MAFLGACEFSQSISAIAPNGNEFLVMLRWKEPASFKRALGRQQGLKPNRWSQLLLALGIVAVCLAGTALHNKPMMGSWPLNVLLAAGAGVFIAYRVPFLAARDPNLVVISERGVGRRVMQGGGVS